MATARNEIISFQDENKLDEVVARIKATRPGLVLATPSEEAIRQFVERAAHEIPLSPEEQRIWDEQWIAALHQIRERNLADDEAEGRV